MKCIRDLVLFSFLFLFITNDSRAAVPDSYFFSVDSSWAGVSSTEDFTNGATDRGAGFTFGYRFTEYSLEMAYRKYSYTNTHFQAEDNVDIVDLIEDTCLSFGLRGSHNDYFETKVGISFNNIVGTFFGTDGSEYYSPVDGFFVGFYFGTGPKFNFDDIEVFTDFTLRSVSKEVFTVGYDIGLRYFF